MKSKLVTAGAAALLFAVASVAHSQVAQPTWTTDQPSAQQQAAPTGTGGQMADQSVGGTPMSGTRDSGPGRIIAPCVVGLSCYIYQGN